MLKKLIIIFCLLFALDANAAIYYVKNGGNDSLDGTSAELAWATITKINTVAFSSGDVINLRAGDTWADARLTLAGVNSAASGIIVQGADFDGKTIAANGKPILNGDAVATPIKISNANLSALTVKNISVVGTAASFVAPWGQCVFYGFSGLTIDGLDGNGRAQTGTSVRPDGFLMLDNYGMTPVGGAVEIKNCTMSGYGYAALPTTAYDTDSQCIYYYIKSGQTSPTSVKIHDNTLSNTQADMIHINGFKGSSVQKLEIYNNTMSNGAENNIDLKSCTYFDIYQNTFSRNWGYGGSSGATRVESLIIIHDVAATGSSYGTIRDNYFNSNHHDTNGDYGPGVIISYTGTNNISVYRNYFKDCFPAVWVTNGADYTNVYRNVIWQDVNPTLVYGTAPGTYGCGIFLHGTSAIAGAEVLNNSIYSKYMSRGIYFYSVATTDTVVKNNAIQTLTTDSYQLYIHSNCAAQSTSLINYNTYYNSADTERVYNRGVAATTFGANDKSEDPGFAGETIGDLSTIVSSSIVNDGVSLPRPEIGLKSDSVWTPSILINTCAGVDNGGIDRGAYEFYEQVTPPPDPDPPTTDGVSSGSTEWGTSVTCTQTVGSGENRLLFFTVAAQGADVTIGTPTVDGSSTGVVALTLQAANSTHKEQSFYKLSPTTGANVIVCAVTGGSASLAIVATSTYNIAQQIPDVSGHNTGATGTSISKEITTTANSAIVFTGIMHGTNEAVAPTYTETEAVEKRLGYGWNDFLPSHPSCKALWRFENGALTTDSSGEGNTLTNNGTVAADTTTYKERAASADLSADTKFFTITDANLASGFPLKSGETNRDITVNFWYRPTEVGESDLIYAKGATSDGYRSFVISKTTGDAIAVQKGHTSGTIYKTYTHASAMTVNQWYFVSVSWDETANRMTIHIWDDTANGVLGTDISDTSDTNEITISSSNVGIGVNSSGSGNFATCKTDEMSVFSTALTTTEMDQVRAGTRISPLVAALSTEVVAVAGADTFGFTGSTSAPWAQTSAAFAPTSTSVTIISIGTATKEGSVYTYEANASSDPAWITAGVKSDRYFAIRLSRQLAVSSSPEPSQIAFLCGPDSDDIGYASYVGHVQAAGGEWLLIYSPVLPTNSRFSHLAANGDGSQSLVMHDAVMVDGDGNSLDANADGYVDIGGTDFDGTGTVSASVVGSFTIGSGGDYESWPASLSFLPGDTISLSGDLTSDVDAGAYNGTEAAPIVLLGNGHTLPVLIHSATGGCSISSQSMVAIQRAGMQTSRGFM